MLDKLFWICYNLRIVGKLYGNRHTVAKFLLGLKCNFMTAVKFRQCWLQTFYGTPAQPDIGL